jgi:cyanophycinase
MAGVDSVETLVVSSREAADSRTVEKVVRDAEVVFFAGGDQCNYVKDYADTRLAAAVEHVWERGGAVGGTSAGAMIQGERIYDACDGWANSAEALSDPYRPTVTLSPALFPWSLLSNVVVDTHFVQRDRMGRLMAFLARQLEDGDLKKVLGLGVSERTSILVDGAGRAEVMGEGPVYLVLADHRPENCSPGKPLTFSDFRIWRISTGEGFSLSDWPGSGGKVLSVREGALSEPPY